MSAGSLLPDVWKNSRDVLARRCSSRIRYFRIRVDSITSRAVRARRAVAPTTVVPARATTPGGANCGCAAIGSADAEAS